MPDVTAKILNREQFMLKVVGWFNIKTVYVSSDPSFLTCIVRCKPNPWIISNGSGGFGPAKSGSALFGLRISGYA